MSICKHVVALAVVGLLFGTGCDKSKADEQDGDKTAAADEGAGEKKADEAKADDEAKSESGGWEELKKHYDANFGMDRMKDKMEDKIADFKKEAGEPSKKEGKKEYWYAKSKDGKCMEISIEEGVGARMGPSDDANCK